MYFFFWWNILYRLKISCPRDTLEKIFGQTSAQHQFCIPDSDCLKGVAKCFSCLMKPNSKSFPTLKWDFCSTTFAAANPTGYSGSWWNVHIPVAFLIVQFHQLSIFTNAQDLDKYFQICKVHFSVSKTKGSTITPHQFFRSINFQRTGYHWLAYPYFLFMLFEKHISIITSICIQLLHSTCGFFLMFLDIISPRKSFFKLFFSSFMNSAMFQI